MADFELEASDGPFQEPTLEELLRALRPDQLAADVVPATVIYGLSDLRPEDRGPIVARWRALSPALKHKVLGALNDASEAMFELSFSEIATLSLEDESALTRAKAVELLWTDESPETMRRLMELAADDRDHTVRSKAVESLGRFILLGEYGDMPAEISQQAQELALRLHLDDSLPIELRRRGLEALSNSSHPQVNALIRAAYANESQDLKLGALFAMGRTCNPIWGDIVLDELNSRDSEYVYEAARACGQLQLKESVRAIAELALGDDEEIQMMAIWALGEIGGKPAFEVLSGLAEMNEDETLEAVIDEALDAASFSLSASSLAIDALED